MSGWLLSVELTCVVILVCQSATGTSSTVSEQFGQAASSVS